jgi:hypothetical protein
VSCADSSATRPIDRRVASLPRLNPLPAHRAFGRTSSGFDAKECAMGWSRQEIEETFEHHQQVVIEIAESWDWARYGDLFTEDATYVEHLYGRMAGREKIREWISSTMNVFPGSEMPFYPVTWYSIDVDKGWVFSEIMNRMRDPGDGSIFEAPCITILRYGGNGLWSNEEDAYNPMNFMPMVQQYIQRSHELGSVSDDARAFAKNMNWQLS